MRIERAVTNGLIGRARLVALAAAGAVCGHAVSYALCLPNAPLRTSVLRQTGHAYWHGAVAGAFVGAAWFALTHIHEHARAGRNHAERPITSFVRLARTSAALQLLIFLTIEVAERLESGAGLRGLLDHNLMAVGIVVQLGVAFALAVATWLLGRTAYAVARAISDRRRRVCARPLAIWPRRVVLLPALTATPPLGGRAPPALS